MSVTDKKMRDEIMKETTANELNEQIELNPVAVFDVRGDVEYEKEHIPGAKTAPLGSLVFRVARIMNPESKVVLYSNDHECDLAIQAAKRLENLGLKNVYYLKDGLSGWKNAGFSTISSPHAKTHARGPVINCRPIVVDRETAYGGAFKGDPTDGEGAGG